MKTKLSFLVATVSCLWVADIQAQSPAAPVMPTKLGAAMPLKHYDVTIRRFDPKKGLEGGQDYVLPVDSIDAEHAITSTLTNALTLTKKYEDGAVLSVAFCCTAITEKK